MIQYISFASSCPMHSSTILCFHQYSLPEAVRAKTVKGKASSWRWPLASSKTWSLSRRRYDFAKLTGEMMTCLQPWVRFIESLWRVIFPGMPIRYFVAKPARREITSGFLIKALTTPYGSKSCQERPSIKRNGELRPLFLHADTPFISESMNSLCRKTLIYEKEMARYRNNGQKQKHPTRQNLSKKEGGTKKIQTGFTSHPYW